MFKAVDIYQPAAEYLIIPDWDPLFEMKSKRNQTVSHSNQLSQLS